MNRETKTVAALTRFAMPAVVAVALGIAGCGGGEEQDRVTVNPDEQNGEGPEDVGSAPRDDANDGM